MKNMMMGALAALALASCTAKADNTHYNVTLPLAGVADDTLVYLMDFDKDAKVDSASVVNQVVTFAGEVTEPFIGRLIIGGARGPMFVVEPGEITFEGRDAKGTILNDRWAAYDAAYAALGQEYKALPDSATDADRQVIIDKAGKLTQSTMDANLDNPFGAYLFLQSAYDMSQQELESALDKAPRLRESKRIAKVLDNFARKAATGAGQKFTDFAIEYEEATQRLSDYAGKGNPVLVDFWASWCGPCRRESAVLKDIYAKYHDQGLEIVGVAVWDEPDNTLEAIEDLQLPWKQIINGQTIPTDLYGILGIPCIVMIDGDGTILFRDLQGDELRAAVDQAMAPASEAAKE